MRTLIPICAIKMKARIGEEKGRYLPLTAACMSRRKLRVRVDGVLRLALGRKSDDQNKMK